VSIKYTLHTLAAPTFFACGNSFIFSEKVGEILRKLAKFHVSTNKEQGIPVLNLFLREKMLAYNILQNK
jgi:hypothetical protein